jgi:hypothetical protein
MAATREGIGLLDVMRNINPDALNNMLCCTSVAYINEAPGSLFYGGLPARIETALEKMERNLNEAQQRVSRMVGMPE